MASRGNSLRKRNLPASYALHCFSVHTMSSTQAFSAAAGPSVRRGPQIELAPCCLHADARWLGGAGRQGHI